MEFRGHCKVVDQPRANRALVRSNSTGAAAAPVQHDLGVFGGPASNRVVATLPGRRHSAEFARTGSKTSVFGSEAAAPPAQPTGRRALTPRSTSPIATPSDSPADASGRPRTGRKANGYWKPDSVLTAENFRPLAAGEKPAVYGAKDGMSFRPHSAQHGKAHLPSANRESILFPKDSNAAADGSGTAAAVLQRYDQRFVRSTSEMARFKVQPEAVRRHGIGEQIPSKGGKLQSGTATAAMSHTLEGVLRPEAHVRAVDRNYRPTPPWR